MQTMNEVQMRNDEYNNITINNREQLKANNEFFKFEGKEFFSQPQNTTNKQELNKQVKNELNDDTKYSTKSTKTKNVVNQDKLIDKAVNSSSSASSESVATSSVASSSAASSAAAASSSAVASTAVASVAGTVVAAAFVVVTAVPVILSTASANLNYFEQSQHTLSYEVEIVDALETETYVAKLNYLDFEETQNLVPGINTGTFNDLVPEQEYTFTIVESNNAEVSRVLLSKTFFSEGEPIAVVFNGANVSSQVDFLNPRELKVTLDYTDNYGDLTDFKISFLTIDPETEEEITITAPLQATTKEQTATFDYDLPIEEGGKYTISYLNKGEQMTYEGTEIISFVDIYSRVSEINSFTLDSQADFKQNVIYATVDYVDGFEKYTGFFISLTDENNNEYSFQLPLSKEKQTISINDAITLSETELDITDGKQFTYDVGYIDKDTVHVVTSSGTIKFEDPNFFVFESINFTEVSFANKTAKVKVNHKGILDEYTGFILTFSNSSNDTYDCEINATDTTTVSLDYDNFDFEHDTISYSLYYANGSTKVGDPLDTGTIDFKEYTDETSTMNIIFEVDDNNKALINSGTMVMNVELDYDDYFNYFSSPYLELSVDTLENPYNINLQLSKDQQACLLDDPSGPNTLINAESVTWSLYYYSINDTQYENPILAKSGTISFADSATSEISGFSVGKFKQYSSYYYLPIKFDIIDEKGLFDYLSITVTNTDTQDKASLYGSNDGNAFIINNYWQYAFLNQNIFSGTSDDNNLTNFKFSFSYSDPETSEDIIVYEKEFSLTIEPSGEDFSPYGVILINYFNSDANTITIKNFIYQGDYLLSQGSLLESINPRLRFVEKASGTVIDEVGIIDEPGGVGGSLTYAITDETLISYINSNAYFDIYLIYTDNNNYGTGSGEIKSILCHEDFQFSII